MTLTPIDAPAAVESGPRGHAALDVEGLTKAFGSRIAVDGISFSVARGEIMGFLGPNGAGKTTTMRMLTGFTPPTSGSAMIAGFDISRHSFEARRRIGYLPENAPLYPEMTVRDYLNFMVEVKRNPRPTRKAYVNRAIDECDLGEVAGRRIGQLSKGFRQRVGLAQAILGDPAVLILDEPTVGLDPVQISEIRALIKSMGGLRTVLLSTHILPEVSMTCQKVVVIDKGRIVASGTPKRLVSAWSRDEPIYVTLDGDLAGARDLVQKIPGVREVEIQRGSGSRSGTLVVQRIAGSDPRRAIARELVEVGYELLEITSPGATLEDVFLNVISSSGGN